jgi:hypothetical protein
MGLVNTLGKILILIGKLMKAEGFGEWLKQYGQELLTNYAPERFKWFRPEKRAISALSAELEQAMRDKGLRAPWSRRRSTATP